MRVGPDVHRPFPGATVAQAQGPHVVEPTLPASARADRFMPPTPLEVFVDAAGQEYVPDQSLDLAPISQPILDHPYVVENLPMLIRRARVVAEARAPEVADGGRERMRAELGPTRELAAQQGAGATGVATECRAAEAELAALDAGLKQVRVRLDALCVLLVTTR